MSIEERPDQIIQVLQRFTSNIKRIAYLVDVPIDLRESRDLDTMKLYTGEVYLAAVVLLHSSFEDCLREIARLGLSDSDEETLDTVPLVGASRTGQPKKFSLGILSKHREKTVHQLIRESVSEFLDRMSFNSSSDIAYIVEKMGVDLSDLRRHFSELDEMISRRHQIVHKADLIGSPGYEEVACIEGQDIVKWLSSVLAFIGDLATHLTCSSDKYTQKEQLELQLLLITEAHLITGNIYAQSRWLLERGIALKRAELETPEMAESKHKTVSLRKALKGIMDPAEIDIPFAQEVADRLSEEWGIDSTSMDASDMQNALRLMVSPAPIASLGEENGSCQPMG
jgi:hypothetical protein